MLLSEEFVVYLSKNFLFQYKFQKRILQKTFIGLFKKDFPLDWCYSAIGFWGIFTFS